MFEDLIDCKWGPFSEVELRRVLGRANCLTLADSPELMHVQEPLLEHRWSKSAKRQPL